MKHLYNLSCNIARTLNAIGDKWTLLIIRQIMIGHDTYKEIQENLTGIPSNLLSERLKALEADGILTTKLYQQHPPRYRYLLTESGEDLTDIYNSLILWGDKHLSQCDRYLAHETCGSPVKIHYYCPSCDETVDSEDLTTIKKAIEMK